VAVAQLDIAVMPEAAVMVAVAVALDGMGHEVQVAPD
jgi:hypothetical protein